MTNSYQIGVSGVRTHEFGLNSWSNNIANINTNGYRANIPEFKSMFATSMDYLNSSSPVSNDQNYGVTTGTNSIDARMGSIVSAPGEFELALNGDGWFAISNRDGTKQYYTKNGEFTRDSEGYLVNGEGFYLQGLDMKMVKNKIYDLRATPSDMKTQDISKFKPIQIQEEVYVKPTRTTFVNNTINLNSSETITGIDSAFLPSLYYNDKKKLFKSDLHKYFNNLEIGDDFRISVKGHPDKNVHLIYGKDFKTIEEFQNALSPSSMGVLNIDQRRIQFKNITDYEVEYSGTLAKKLGLRPDMTNVRLTNSAYLYLKRFFDNDFNTLYNENYDLVGIRDGDTFSIEVNNKISSFIYKSHPERPNEFNKIKDLLDKIQDSTGLRTFVKNCRIVFENGSENTVRVKFHSLNEYLMERLRLPEDVILRSTMQVSSSALSVPTYRSTSEIFDEEGKKFLLKTDYVLQHLTTAENKKEIWLTTSAVFDLKDQNMVSSDHTEGKFIYTSSKERPALYTLKNDTYHKVKEFNIDFKNHKHITFNPTGINDKTLSSNVHFMGSGIKNTDKDGNIEGYNEQTIIDRDGNISLKFSNSLTKQIGRIGMVRFINNQGLRKVGANMFETFSTSVNGEIKAPTAGIPRVLWDKTSGILKSASLLQYKLEKSNVEMSTALTELIIMQRGYSANAKTITTADELIKEAIGLKR